MHLCPELNFCQCVKTSRWRFTALGCSAENWFAHLAGSDSGHVSKPDVNNKQRDLFFLWIIHKSKRLTNIHCVFSFELLPTQHTNGSADGMDLGLLFTVTSASPAFIPAQESQRQAGAASKSLIQIKVNCSAPRSFWWLIDLACGTGQRGVSVWRRAAGGNQRVNKEHPEDRRHEKAATSCPLKPGGAPVVMDGQQKLINGTQIVVLAGALMMTSPVMITSVTSSLHGY